MSQIHHGEELSIKEYAKEIRRALGNLDIDRVRKLLKTADERYRMEIIATRIEGSTALHHCLQERNAEALRVLLCSISKESQLQVVQIPDEKNETVIDVALKQGSEGLLKELLAALDPDVISSFLTSEDLSTGSSYFHSKLMARKCFDRMFFLLHTMRELKLNIYDLVLSEDCKGKTILHHAVAVADSFVLGILGEFISPTQHFAALSHADKSGRTMLLDAAHFDKIDTIFFDCLLEQLDEKERKILVLKRDEDGKTAVHDAVEKNNARTIQCLLKYLSTQEQLELLRNKSHKDTTLLHIAAELGKNEAVEVLTAISSNHSEQALSEQLLICDGNNQTMLHHAHNLEEKTVQKLLREIQADRVTITLWPDHIGETAISKAIHAKKQEIVLAFLENLSDKEKLEVLLPDNNLDHYLVPPLSPLHLLTLRDNSQLFKAVMLHFECSYRFKVICSRLWCDSFILHIAACEQNLEVLEFILSEYGLAGQQNFLQLKDNEGKNVLEVAVTKPSLNDWVFHKEKLLSWDVITADIIIAAAVHNDDSFVQRLLELVPAENHVSLLKTKGSDGNMLLHRIAHKLKTLKYLLRIHQSSLSWMLLTEKNHEGRTGLHLMALNPCTEVKDVACVLNNAGNIYQNTSNFLKIFDLDQMTPVAVAKQYNVPVYKVLSCLPAIYYLFKPPTALIIYYSYGREGADLEKNKLYEVLCELGLNPTVKENLRAADIPSCIATVVESLGMRKNCISYKPEYPDISALFVFIMCHGESGIIVDHENNSLLVQTVVNEMAEVTSNDVIVPKVLVLQSCQGHGNPTLSKPASCDVNPKTAAQNSADGDLKSSAYGSSNSSAVLESNETSNGTYAVISQVAQEVTVNSMPGSTPIRRVPTTPTSSYAHSSSLFLPTMPSIHASPQTPAPTSGASSGANKPSSLVTATLQRYHDIRLPGDFLVLLPSRDGLMAKRNFFIPILSEQLERMKERDDMYDIFYKLIGRCIPGI